MKVPTRKWIAFTLTFIFLSTGVISFFNSSSVKNSVKIEDTFGNNWPDYPDVRPNEIPLYYQINSFDPENQIANLLVYPWPVNELGTPYYSSTVTKVPLKIFIDTIDRDGVHIFNTGDPVPGIPIRADAYNPLYLPRASDLWYPFDQYSMATETQVEADLSDDGKADFKPIPLFDYFYTSEVAGFSITYKRVAHPQGDPENFQGTKDEVIEARKNGQSVVLAIVKRHIAIQLIAIMLSIFVYVIAGTLTWAAIQVRAGRRRPNATTLVWAATTVLALIQFRSLLPGKPRLGILLDYLVFFPAMAATLFALPMLAVTWLKTQYTSED
jgi:Domain of unknown function (DUF4436)